MKLNYLNLPRSDVMSRKAEGIAELWSWKLKCSDGLDRMVPAKLILVVCNTSLIMIILWH